MPGLYHIRFQKGLTRWSAPPYKFLGHCHALGGKGPQVATGAWPGRRITPGVGDLQAWEGLKEETVPPSWGGQMSERAGGIPAQAADDLFLIETTPKGAARSVARTRPRQSDERWMPCGREPMLFPVLRIPRTPQAVRQSLL